MISVNMFVLRFNFLEACKYSFAVLFEVVCTIRDGGCLGFQSCGNHEEVIARMLSLHR